MLNNVQIQNWLTDFDLLMHKKELLVKENSRGWNSQLQSKRVDLETNEADDRDKNSNAW